MEIFDSEFRSKLKNFDDKMIKLQNYMDTLQAKVLKFQKTNQKHGICLHNIFDECCNKCYVNNLFTKFNQIKIYQCKQVKLIKVEIDNRQKTIIGIMCNGKLDELYSIIIRLDEKLHVKFNKVGDLINNLHFNLNRGGKQQDKLVHPVF